MNTIEVDIHDGVARVTLNRPEQRNAIDARMAAELCETLASLGRESSLQAVVLAGAGPAFCAGADLRWMSPGSPVTEAQARQDAELLSRLFQTLDDCPCPVVGCIHGSVFGGGVGLVAACDVVIAAEDAVFKLSEIRLGLVPAIIMPYLLRKTGESFLRHYGLTGEAFSAGAAQQARLVHGVVPPDALEKRTAELIGTIRLGGPEAVRATKALIRRLASTAGPERQALCAGTNVRARLSAEAQEGLRAFFDKRPPAWARGVD